MTSKLDERTQDASHRSVLNQLSSVLPIVDFTELARQCAERDRAWHVDGLSPADVEDRILRTLYLQPRRHVMLTGPKGVGKTTLVRFLAQKAAGSQIPSLSEQRFLWIDCQNVGPEDSRACLESLFAAITALDGVVVCLDGMAALLKRNNGGTNKPLLRAMISRPGMRLIGVMSGWEYNDLVGGDAQMLEQFSRIEID